MPCIDPVTPEKHKNACKYLYSCIDARVCPPGAYNLSIAQLHHDVYIYFFGAHNEKMMLHLAMGFGIM